jgi:hypothetical protein
MKKIDLTHLKQQSIEEGVPEVYIALRDESSLSENIAENWNLTKENFVQKDYIPVLKNYINQNSSEIKDISNQIPMLKQRLFLALSENQALKNDLDLSKKKIKMLLESIDSEDGLKNKIIAISECLDLQIRAINAIATRLDEEETLTGGYVTECESKLGGN